MKIFFGKDFLLGGHKYLRILKALMIVGVGTWIVAKIQTKPTPLVSPLPDSTGGSNALSAGSPAEEKTYQTVSYYITTSQGFLTKAREMAQEEQQQTPQQKQKIIELVNQALDVINQGIAAYPLDDRVFAQRAAIYQALTPFLPEAGKFAIQDLREATKLNNQNPSYYTRLANLYLGAGDFEGAALAFYNAYQLEPTNLQTLYNLADCLEKSGQLTKASRYFEKLLGLLPAGDENLPGLQSRLETLKAAIAKSGLKYLSEPGEIAPAASSQQKEIIGTQELPLEQAMLAKGVIIAEDNPRCLPNPTSKVGECPEFSTIVSVNAKSGEGVIPAGKTETIIYNNNVGADKQIVIVPFEGDFKNRVVFVAAKKASDQECQPTSTPGVSGGCGWFKVGVDSPPKDKIKFKWWIVE